MKYMNSKTAIVLFSSAVLLGLSGCEGTDGIPSDTQLVGSVGKLPVAVANTNPEKVRCALNTKTPNLELNGTKSFDPDGEIVSYMWYITNNGTDYAFIGDGAVLTIDDPCAKIENKAGEYSIKLSVEDNDGNVNSDIVDVKAVENKPPVAQAGPDKPVDYNGSITLNGSLHSYDPDGQIVEYSWDYNGDVKTGAIVTYDNLTTEGDNTITLTVTDNDGATASDPVVITVQPQQSTNRPPVAKIISPENGAYIDCVDSFYAKTTQAVTEGPTNSLTLTGTGTDPDGDTLTYAWSAWSEDGSGFRQPLTEWIDNKNQENASINITFTEDSFCGNVTENCNWDNENGGCPVTINLNVDDGTDNDNDLMTIYVNFPE